MVDDDPKLVIAETKIMLALVVDSLRQIAEETLYTEEMAWRLYVVGLQNIPRFEEKYQTQTGTSFERIHQKRRAIVATLDQIKQRLQGE
jgi:hypothetical protein